MTARRAAGVVAFSVVGCSVVGCGGGGSASGGAPAVGAGFAKRAAAVCQKALKSKEAWEPFPVANFDPAAPDRPAFPKVASWLKQQVAPTFDAWLAGLRRLGRPKSGGQAWSDTIEAVARIDRDNQDQITAAERRDTRAFAAATTDLGTAQRDLESASAASGVPSCADVHKG